LSNKISGKNCDHFLLLRFYLRPIPFANWNNSNSEQSKPMMKNIHPHKN
jgi:hypothetical protein